MYSFSNPVQNPKSIIFFHNPVRKNTLVQNLCGLRVHIKFIFWGSQQQWFGKSHGATGFLNMESVHQHLHWRKISEETKRDNYLSLSIAICPCLSFTQWLTQVSISPFVCLPNRVAYKSVHFCFTGWRVFREKTKQNKTNKQNNISHHLTGNPNHSQERINHFLDLAPSDCSGRRSWQLICLRAFDYSATKLRVLASSRAGISCPTV